MRRAKSNGGLTWRRLALALCVLVLSLSLSARDEPRLEVRGLGWLGNREAERSLELLLGKAENTLGAGQLEDAALILISQLSDEGYLEPKLTVRLRHADGRETRHVLTADLAEPLPRPLAVREARLEVERGPRFLYREIRFTGLTALPEDWARSFFAGESMLIPLSDERVYSPGRLTRGVNNLREQLLQAGYSEALVRVGELAIDRASGAVRAEIVVQEGALRRVGTVQVTVSPGAPPPPPELTKERAGRPWSRLWGQDLATALRRWYYRRGYPDVQVDVRPEEGPIAEGTVPVAVVATVAAGPLVHLGTVRFAGNAHTREAPLRRLVRVRDGALFDPVAFDDGQSRLARLGVFSSVGFRSEPTEGDTRDVLYEVTEGRRQEFNLLAGYGSYEQLRGGFEWRHFNLWGRAHTDNLKLVQSMKSSRGDYIYTVPELFGTSLDGTARLFGLRRDERSFTREEYGASASVQWPWRALHAQLTSGYTFQRLNSSDNDLATRDTDLARVDAASVNFGIVQDRRDNPLTPHRGTKFFAQAEIASRELGGQVDYQQMRLGVSYHTAWGRGRWIHVGLTHGAVLTLGAGDDRRLPVNVRFFPGGESSIRGYGEGEAAPRAANGEFVGAKSYVLLNVELEQALTSRWSVVLFGDALGIAARIADYPFAEELYALGLGVRYRTPIGPVRLEYGRNLNPRSLDPSGAFHLSIGVPF
ncbi:MAG: BamA/TamA family outer membrane protein [Opitutaceae bacterium]